MDSSNKIKTTELQVLHEEIKTNDILKQESFHQLKAKDTSKFQVKYVYWTHEGDHGTDDD